MTLNSWLASISDWYQAKHDKSLDSLEQLVYSAPTSIWGPELTDNQSKAIACWLDGCLRVFGHAKYHNIAKAFQTLQYISSKLEMAAFNSAADIEIKDWCIKRLQHITVLSLEFCNQQHDQPTWNNEANTLIENHVKLMASVAWNEKQTPSNIHNSNSLH